jgi:hypothetical protein
MSDLKTIDLNLLPLETLAEMANEAAEQAENNAKATVQRAMDAGRFLNAAKEQCQYGTWLAWLGANWNYKHATASAYMQIANFQHAGNLKDAKSIREALRMIGEEKEDQPDVAESAIVPRAERKTGRVEVEKVGQPIVQAEEAKPAKDDDPNPAPKTNTKHSPVTAKAKEADRPAPQIVTPVIVEEPEATKEPDDPFRYCTFDTIIEIAIGKLSDSDDQRKQAAKRLRKLADKLDPPKPSAKFQRPDLDECLEFFQEHDSNQGETFFDFYESKGWLVGKVSMKNWQAAGRKWIRENQQNGINSNGRQSAAQAREQSNADSFAQLRLAISQEQSGET